MPDPARLSVQLYTVREALRRDFDATLARIAAYGYRQVEPFDLLGMLDKLRAGLPAHGLAAPTTHARVLSADDQDEVFAAARALGVGTVIDPFTEPARWQSAAGITEIAAGLNAAAERARPYGLRVGYHNHHFELESRIDGRHGLEVLAERLDPAVVLEVDTYWAYAGGADVPALLARLGERVVAIHVKDGDGSLNTSTQVPVGSGALPVGEILAAAPSALLVVELDDSAGDLIEAVGASREFLVGGAAG